MDLFHLSTTELIALMRSADDPQVLLALAGLGPNVPALQVAAVERLFVRLVLEGGLGW